MIEISTIEENLDKINAVYSFIGLIEVHYSVSKDRFLFDIRNAKECLKNTITLWAKDINGKVLNSGESHDYVPEAINNINECIKSLDNFLKEKKFKNIESLELELKEFTIFLEKYSKQQGLDKLAKNKHEINSLKGKIFFLTS